MVNQRSIKTDGVVCGKAAPGARGQNTVLGKRGVKGEGTGEEGEGEAGALVRGVESKQVVAVTSMYIRRVNRAKGHRVS